MYINGDGETSRDFCFIANAVQANLLAATACSTPAAPTLLPLPLGEGRGEGSPGSPNAPNESPVNQVYNVAVGDRTTLNELYAQLHCNLLPLYPHLQGTQPVYRDFRSGDVRHSLADISKARRLLGYAPTQRIGEGLALAMPWYVAKEQHEIHPQATGHQQGAALDFNDAVATIDSHFLSTGDSYRLPDRQLGKV